jgi:4'-phosphopantetheinyl transferase
MNTSDTTNKTLNFESLDTSAHQETATKLHSTVSLQILFARTGSILSRKVEDEYLAIMPTWIRGSILRYKRWQDRQATLFGKMLLFRALCMKCTDTAMQKFQSQEVSQYGRPFIAGGPDFNISHSGDIVVLALAENGLVGIDIEEIRLVNVEDYLRQIPEITNVHEKLDVSHANNFFFDCWTKKEAVLKAYGEGLLAPLEYVVLKEDTAHFLETSWFTKKMIIEEGYCCHVATDQPVKQLAVERVDLLNCNYDLQG